MAKGVNGSTSAENKCFPVNPTQGLLILHWQETGRKAKGFGEGLWGQPCGHFRRKQGFSGEEKGVYERRLSSDL